ncbi:MAG: 16S rRNA (guanine(966)-N(2))-methyltransferase RsmD [Lachnospiraceae bacterium]|nr:16S rRNA (guanine(966)-N(2))-methyltransferase RsmD [Lachnospiraceae bacterium]
MRVIAGTARSMPLRTVKGMDVRPTTDRTKETLFNILQFRIPGCRFLDLYAGSGQIGIEALSRGADFACFVEKDRKTQKLIQENLEFTKLDSRGRLYKGDTASVLPQLEREEPFDIIFMDPPFDHLLEKETLTYLSGSRLLSEGGVVVVEASPQTDFSYVEELGFRTISHRIYGQSTHLFLERA